MIVKELKKYDYNSMMCIFVNNFMLFVTIIYFKKLIFQGRI